MANAAENNVGVGQEYAGKSLRRQCECEMCRTGETNHDDESHDQSLYSQFSLKSRYLSDNLHLDDSTQSHSFRLVGGSTKCGRVMSQYFGGLDENLFAGKSIVEVGSGSGIVGSSLALLGARCVLTDQAPVMDLLRVNLNQNLPGRLQEHVELKEFMWGSEISSLLSADSPLDFVIGSDLIYAHEGIPPLVKSFEDFVFREQAAPPNNAPPRPAVYLAVIRRFKWEENFFKLMSERFHSERVHQEGDIDIYRFTGAAEVAPLLPPHA